MPNLHSRKRSTQNKKEQEVRQSLPRRPQSHGTAGTLTISTTKIAGKFNSVKPKIALT